MSSLCRRLLRASPRNRLVSPLSFYATEAKPKPKPKSKPSNASASDSSPPAPRRSWSRSSPKPSEPPASEFPTESPETVTAEWARPSAIPFQAKVENSVQLIGYVHAPVQFQTTDGGSSWAATVLTQNPSSDSNGDNESPDSLPLWVPVIFEGDLAHIAASHLKENDHVYITGQLRAGLPHLNGSQVQASVQVMVHDVSFVEKGFQKKSFSNVSIQSEREIPISSDSPSTHMSSIVDPWKDLLDNPKEWWDNRAAKLSGSVSRNYPDFKRKDASNVLWLNRAPRSILLKLEGLEFDAQIQGSKDSGDSGSDLWTDLIDNPQEWCDYRSIKLQGLVNPKFPDFKRKDGSCPLWLNNVPWWILPKLEGLEFHVPAQKSKAVTDGKLEELWKDLLENPNKWWDNRLNKIKERAPDFKHKETGEALWLSDSPTWVTPKLPPPKSKGDTLLS